MPLPILNLKVSCDPAYVTFLFIPALPNPIQAPLMAAEREREVMVARRVEFFDSMGDDPLTEETIAFAEFAKIFIT